MIAALRHARDFERLRREGRRVRRGPLSVLALVDAGLVDTRVAFAIRRRHGSAVERNRTRRRLRHACRDLDRAGAIPTGWYLLTPSDDSTRLGGREWTSVLMNAFSELKVGVSA